MDGRLPEREGLFRMQSRMLADLCLANETQRPLEDKSSGSHAVGQIDDYKVNGLWQ